MENEHSLFFLRHGKLTLPYKDHSEMPMNVLADLASSKLNPPIDAEFALQQIPRLSAAIPFKDIGKIYNSPALRCRETAGFLSKFIFESYGRSIEPVTTEALREIKFDLSKILSQGDENTFNINSLNDSVFKAMTTDSEYCESVNSAYRRVDGFLKVSGSSEPTLFITHDFIMRVIEIYIRGKRERQSEMTYEGLKKTKRNLYLQGFATDPSFESFLAI